MECGVTLTRCTFEAAALRWAAVRKVQEAEQSFSDPKTNMSSILRRNSRLCLGVMHSPKMKK
jgi:hypothetical protein